MKHFIFDQHSIGCLDRGENWCNPRKHCELNPINILLFIHGVFILLTINNCMFTDKYNLLQELISKAIGKKVKHKDEIETFRNVYDKKFKDQRKQGFISRRYVDEVHYTYSDNARKQYCITSRYKLFSYLNITSISIIDKNYKDAKEYLSNNGYEYLLSELDELYRINQIYISNADIIKTTDLLIKNIKHEIKRKSEHQ